MSRPKWPKLPVTTPSDLKDHAVSLGDSFDAIQAFLKAGVSHVAPSLPNGIKHKIKNGITSGLVEVESREYSNTCVSANDRDLISKAIFEEINAKTAPAFNNRVPQYLFKILHDSYNELRLKIVNQQNAIAQQGLEMAGTASVARTMPQTPPKSPVEVPDSALSCSHGSDTEAFIYHDWERDKSRLQVRASNLRAQLDEVRHERKATRQRLKETSRNIKKQILEVDREEKAADRRQSESLKTMELRRSERDRTGDYGTDAIGYDVEESVDFRLAKRNLTSRCVTLEVENQAVVNRLFNMPASVLMRKIREAITQKTKPVRDERLPGIEKLLGADLLDDGNVTLWAECIENHAFDCLPRRPHWDQAIFGSFASHLTEPYETYPVEVKDITAEMVGLRDRKQKAAVITKLVKCNLMAIPLLHIDIIKDIRFSRSTTHDNTQALVIDISNAEAANEIVHQGLKWEGRTHLCEVFDDRFLDLCGRCQEYGHHANTCDSLPRCGNCADQHSTKVCNSSYIKCLLCEEPHRAGSSRCRAKKARRVDKLNARFPLEHCPSPGTVPSKEPELAISTLNSPKPDVPAPQIEQLNTNKEDASNSGSVPMWPFSSALTPPAQELQRLSAIEMFRSWTPQT